MRHFLTFPCEGATLAATLDAAQGETGLLIVSGGNEIRIGAHRGMEKLAADLAAHGHPVFRFDRRGIGDSEGDNGGFEASGPDIQAAIRAFRSACPALKRIIAFGNCDAASALVLHRPEGLCALVLSNIWVVEPRDDLPPTAAIKSHYLQRLKDPKAWVALASGAINFRKLASGLARLAAPKAPSALSDRISATMASGTIPAHILLARRDGTALAFAEAWTSPAFAAARKTGLYRITRIDSNAHSFARAADYAALKSALLECLSGN
jgi:exosortase A-associated hydrolase 1